MEDHGRAWVCCQLGAREHFMVPAALHRRGALSRLITDAWLTPRSMLRAAAPRLRDRFHPGLDGCVTAFTCSAMAFEAREAAGGSSGWPRMLRRNDWFQAKAIESLRQQDTGGSVLFSYSYAARQLFAYAQQRRWTTVMAQIDPGPEEERLVARLHAAHPGLEPGWQPAPEEYWRRWREEIDLADHIVVHSEWSRDALARAGVKAEKLVVIPLAYEPPVEAAAFDRAYPDRFTAERPLRVLFLGQVILRKGAGALLEAARELQHEPIEFIVAGPNALNQNVERAPGRITWIGSVPRGGVAAFYRDADLFLFPTQSDGFGLTQLEAQAWRLPVLATDRCGAVVRDGVNGCRLSEGSGAEIASVLRDLARDPARLRAMSRSARVDEGHSPDDFAAALLDRVSSSTRAIEA
jgi:glycosyltransferase involved in cell wall biosynthesis